MTRGDSVGPMISVILPTRNRADLLSRALDSLDGQTLARPSFEIIVVDNGSTDDTRQVVERAQARLGNIEYAYVQEPGLHVARHAGLHAARAEILLFGDDDIRAAPTWVEAALRAFDDPAVGLAGGKCLPDFDGPVPEWFAELWSAVDGGRAMGPFSLVDLGDEERDIEPWLVYGCNYAVRRSLVVACGGFNPDAMPRDRLLYRGDGETGLSRKIASMGHRVRYAPLATVFHQVPARRLTATYLRDRAIAQGISDSYSAARYGRPIAIRYLTALRLRLAAWRASRPAVREIRTAQARGYLEGLRFHRQHLRADTALNEWVRQKSYLNHDGS